MKKISNGILADTCIWIEFFRSRSAIGGVLETFIKENRVWICGCILSELIQGIQSETEKNRIVEALSDLNYIEMSKHLWQSSGEISAFIKKKGFSIPLSDIMIAAIAIEYNLHIFTLDKHFDSIPNVKIYESIPDSG